MEGKDAVERKDAKKWCCGFAHGFPEEGRYLVLSKRAFGKRNIAERATV